MDELRSTEVDSWHHEGSPVQHTGDRVSCSQLLRLFLVLDQPLSTFSLVGAFPKDITTVVPPEQNLVAIASGGFALLIVADGDDEVGWSNVDLVVGKR